MSHYQATVLWQRPPDVAFTDGRYSRVHLWRFDGGVEVPASASPHVVPLPFSAAEPVDPEEAYVAALASCHMLTFLSIAARRRFVVDRYGDTAEGVMEKNGDGRLAVTRVVLNPRVAYVGPAPDRTVEEAMHHAAHEQCFLANSVRTMIETRLG
ncbi:OsmC family protein [Inquilinus limosus]|uniref:Peroxiredoxin n=1 Tax=Inquilinus limosus TaxID=171674 RepID=A0A211ZLF6_9PROT|nr:OsmC family protein [Inquilinus limosus]OWJ66115.1 peroxiredoxin [Inquilinus limosus]